MSRIVRHALAMLLWGAIALGCAVSPLSGGRPMHLSEIDAPSDPARRASLRMCLLGLDEETAGRRGSALGHYERAIQVDPTNPYAYLVLARYEVDGGDPQRALQYVAQAETLLASEQMLSPGAEANVAGLRGLALQGAGRDGSEQLATAQRLAPEVWGDGRLDPEELR